MATFASVDDLEHALQRGPLDVTTATLRLRQATAAIQREARQRIELVTDDQFTLRGNWGEVLLLPERPVLQVSNIIIRNADLFGAEIPLAEGVDYRWDRFGRVRRIGFVAGRLPWPQRGWWGGDLASVEGLYSHGNATIPEDIWSLCLQIAGRLYTNPDRVASEQVGGYQVTYQSGADGGIQLTEDERRQLRDYRRLPQALRSLT